MFSTSLLPVAKSASEVSATDSASVPVPGAAVPSTALMALEAMGDVARVTTGAFTTTSFTVCVSLVTAPVTVSVTVYFSVSLPAFAAVISPGV